MLCCTSVEHPRYVATIVFMSKSLATLLARTAVDQIETQHGAVERLVQAAAGEPGEGTNLARTALYGLLTSPRLGVVSKACHGEFGIFLEYS